MRTIALTATFLLVTSRLASATPPNVTIRYEPVEDGKVKVQRMAYEPGSSPFYHLALAWSVTSHQAAPVTVSSIGFELSSDGWIPPGHPTDVVVPGWGSAVDAMWQGGPGGWWISLADPLPATLQITMSFAGGYDPIVQTYPLERYQAPIIGSSLGSFAKISDLRPNEVWHGQSQEHSRLPLGCGNLALTLLLSTTEDDGDPHTSPYAMPGGDPNVVEDLRIWHKPVYAAASGYVREVVDGLPPGWEGPLSTIAGHLGNSIAIETEGRYQVHYGHLAAGTLNPDIDWVGAYVEEGTFLGLVGEWNLKLIAVATDVSNPFPDCSGPMRGLVFDELQITNPYELDYVAAGDFAAANWAPLENDTLAGHYGFGTLIWPSASAPVNLRIASLDHFDIGTDGQLWAVLADDQLLTTTDRLVAGQPTGVYLGVDPGGTAKGVAYASGVPYRIAASNDTVYRGTPGGWVSTGRTARRITVDESNGKLWAIGLDDKIYTMNMSTFAWAQATPTTARAKDIAVRNGIPFVLGMDDKVYKRVNSDFVLQNASIRLSRLTIDGASGTLWGLGINSSEPFYSTTGTSWTNYSSQRASEITVFDGQVFLLDTFGKLRRQTPQGFELVNVVREE